MKRYSLVLLFSLAVAGLLLAGSRAGAAGNGLASVLSAPFDLSWWTADGGGQTATSGGNYTLGGTTGQADAGALGGGNYSLSGGFWNSAVAAGTATPTPPPTPAPPTPPPTPAPPTPPPTPAPPTPPPPTPPPPTPAAMKVYLPIIIKQP
jgi:hypothetical protein